MTDDTAAPPAGSLAGVDPRPGVAKPDPILVVDGVSRSFGGLRAVDVDHLEIQRGAITSLIGPNGAGKTTFFNLLTGFDQPDDGRVVLEGRALERTIFPWRPARRTRPGEPDRFHLEPLRVRTRAHEVARRGMVRTFQLTKVLSRLTVMDNMRLGATGQRGERMLAGLSQTWKAQEASITERAATLIERFDLAAMTDEFAGTMSGGQRKLLEMARALMAEPSVVLLDEPMAGVNPALTQSLLGHVTELRDDGMTVVFVEHDMDVVMEISDWVVCMAEGRIIAEGPPEAVASNPDVVDAYLGRQHGGVA